jgi:hypothetical protein
MSDMSDMSDETTRYRCEQCGNKTRFDVFETRRVRAFQHFTLGGELTVESEEVLHRAVERVVCRWCGSAEAVGQEPVLAPPPGREAR